MDGCSKTSMIIVTTRVLLFACSRSRMETALEVILTPSGNIQAMASLLATAMLSFSTCPAIVTFLVKKQDRIYIAVRMWGHVSLEE